MRYMKRPVPVRGESVKFESGLTYIISRVDSIHKVDVLVDKEITLDEIAVKYPYVCKVIHEGEIRGVVYNYGNHSLEPGKVWEMVGATVGYS